ncbi:hypothetical protein BH09BAC2_BH09BAC2_19270 [soil metagenome]
MKKLVLIFIFSISYSVAFSQYEKNVITDRPPQVIYFQVGGSAPAFSLNYDRRISSTTNGFGFALGIGYYGFSQAHVFSIPASVNYLFGSEINFIELAAGATFINGTTSKILNGVSTNESDFLYHFNAGYRYQPAAGQFFFRIGASPLFGDGGYITSFYLGLGHNF